MRRSKSNPAKYARNYRSISQRRMTEHDGLDEDKEIERLKQVLKTSKAQFRHDDVDDGNEKTETVHDTHSALDKSKADASAYDQDPDELIIIPAKKKIKNKKSQIELTPQEIRRAKLAHKNATRKLSQLAARGEQKKKRADLYSKLLENAVTKEETALLSSSSTLGKRETKREALKRLLQRERAGVPLTADEQALLYSERDFSESIETPSAASVETTKNVVQEPEMPKKKKRKKERNSLTNENDDSPNTFEMTQESTRQQDTNMEDHVVDTKVSGPSSAQTPPSPPPIDFAAQMMAGFATLKKKADEGNQKALKDQPMSELERIALEEENRPKSSVYIPENPVMVKTAATLGIKPHVLPTSRNKCIKIERPPEVEAKRFDLPVSGMEYEIMDAVRNNDVTILCSETGSGKSTQAPQFLYEAGYTTGNLLIGVTQPRRVAAVSTAKRVCYEMGQGNGQTIRSKSGQGNLVAYQTRYESAGLGRSTHLKFMTDGILLQEIQSDLLLRKYAVIILDEAHERNLNTDVLLGLLSVAIPLRRKASEESGSNILPLKLLVMSATLRVEDFTENERLFPNLTPAVIRVPGRTHPVTIHHSKVTELDDYENMALKKVLKIHRNLPKGGILVFLTGKQEIVRVVNRLRKRLKGKEIRSTIADKDVTPADTTTEVDGFRDMDDDDMDGEIFREDDFDNGDSDEDDTTEDLADEGDEEGIPRDAIILPLYSMLSVEDQASVFAPVPEGHRLIVVATNIAETSITIPGISYVVDTGRQKVRNYHASTGVASYDIMWVSKAAADQRAGRAGRTGPGHCYRLYSSSMYGRHMEDYALPEVLVRPLEDIVLAMKAMNVTNVSKFPFPTPPDESQIDAAIKLLANLGCMDISRMEETGEDGRITKLGLAVAKLPLGVRYGKMLLVAAQAGVLDYAIAMVAVLSENTPFLLHGGMTSRDDGDVDDKKDENEDLNDVKISEKEHRRELRNKWKHRGGDVLAGMLAVGAYSYAGQGAGGSSETAACARFCEENGLSHSVMIRIQNMRHHLARLAKTRLSSSDSVASRTGGIATGMRPPNQLQESLLRQAICSGLLDNVAMLAPPGSVSGDYPMRGFRSAYISCSLKEPVLIDQMSAVYTRDFRRLPQWVCYNTLVRKTTADGTPFVTVKSITPIDPSWLGVLSQGSRLLSSGAPIPNPPATYDADSDAIVCAVTTKYGSRGWEIPPLQVPMYDILQRYPSNKVYLPDDSYRFFARFLIEGKVLPESKILSDCWNDEASIITRRTPIRKVGLLIITLSSAEVDSAGGLRQYWAESDRKFLYDVLLKGWVKQDQRPKFQRVWMNIVKQNIKSWKEGKKQSEK